MLYKAQILLNGMLMLQIVAPLDEVTTAMGRALLAVGNQVVSPHDRVEIQFNRS